MKRILLPVTAGLLFALAACHEKKLDAAIVPAAVKASFAKIYPGTTPEWEKEDGNYEVAFKKDSMDMSMLIQPDGVILETEAGIHIADLPAGALAYVKEHYPGKKIKEAARITKGDQPAVYEAEVGDKDVLFDLNGHFIKEVEKED